MAMQTKIGYGNKTDIDTAIAATTIDEGDIIITKDTEELAFIKPDKSVMYPKDRTSKEYTLNGTSLGALNNGEKIPEGSSIDDLLNMITQKPLAPSYAQPTVTLAKSGSGTAAGSYEAGTSITPVLTATFNKNDAGDLTKLAILKGNEEVGSDVSSPYTYTGEAIVLGDETVTFKARVTYNDGSVKNNNLGQPDATGQIKAGTKDSSVISFVGQRNLFWGTGVGELPALNSDTVRGLTNKKLNPTQGYSFTINVSVGQQNILICYPSSLRDISKVHYVEGNDPNLAQNFSKTNVNVADARGGENGLKEYKCYTLHLSTPAQATMTLNVTI